MRGYPGAAPQHRSRGSPSASLPGCGRQTSGSSCGLGPGRLRRGGRSLPITAHQVDRARDARLLLSQTSRHPAAGEAKGACHLPSSSPRRWGASGERTSAWIQVTSRRGCGFNGGHTLCGTVHWVRACAGTPVECRTTLACEAPSRTSLTLNLKRRFCAWEAPGGGRCRSCSRG